MVKDMVEQAYGYAFILAAHAAARTAGVQSSVLEIRTIFIDFHEQLQSVNAL